MLRKPSKGCGGNLPLVKPQLCPKCCVHLVQGANYAGSPGRSSGGSDSSMMHGGASQPGTPGSGAMYAHGGPSMVWSGFCQPMPYSPTALQIAAASGALGSDPSTPVRGVRRSSSGGGGSGGGAAGGPFLAVMPGSPMMASPGQMMFAQVGGMRQAVCVLSEPLCCCCWRSRQPAKQLRLFMCRGQTWHAG